MCTSSVASNSLEFMDKRLGNFKHTSAHALHSQLHGSVVISPKGIGGCGLAQQAKVIAAKPEFDPGTHCSKLSSTCIPLCESARTNTYKPNVKKRRGRKVSGTLASVPAAGSRQGKEKGRVPVVATETGFRVFVARGTLEPQVLQSSTGLVKYKQM